MVRSTTEKTSSVSHLSTSPEVCIIENSGSGSPAAVTPPSGEDSQRASAFSKKYGVDGFKFSKVHGSPSCVIEEPSARSFFDSDPLSAAAATVGMMGDVMKTVLDQISAPVSDATEAMPDNGVDLMAGIMRVLTDGSRQLG